MITLAYGIPGSGKSTLLHDLVRVQAHTHRFFVRDHEDGWGPGALQWRGADLPVYRMRPGALWTPEDWPDNGVFTFGAGWESLAVVELARAVGWATYVDDELDQLARRAGWLNSPLRAIVHEGRHLLNALGEYTQCHLMGACRRPQNLHTDVTDLADQVFVFRVQGSRTLKRLLDDSMIEDEDWERIRSLPKFHFLHWPSGEWGSSKPIG